MNQIQKIYTRLLTEYGPQGWWPLLDLHTTNSGTNPTKTGSISGYHPNNYKYPKTKNQQWEIIAGALLTQNTSWPQVEKALINLKTINALTPSQIIKTNPEKIKQAIKPAGYFNQKADRLILLAKWFQTTNHTNSKPPTRTKLLSLKGIGPETADSIRLYAFSQPEFVIDAYSKRIFSRIGLTKIEDNYDKVKELFQKNLTPETETFQEYHALIVEHAKRFCKTKPECTFCPLNKICKKIID